MRSGFRLTARNFFRPAGGRQNLLAQAGAIHGQARRAKSVLGFENRRFEDRRNLALLHRKRRTVLFQQGLQSALAL